ncbi:MAG: nucleotide sugar dehydrogenase [Actinomycetota bacterium]|nr:nucleotide sugar dehydrogenase [Actinomycetota bacterium]
MLAVKSTMDIGACRRLAARLPSSGPSLVYNPEFLRQGSALSDFLHPAKAVIGADNTCASAAVRDVLEPLSPDPVKTDWETAELIKLAHNAFNALRISFVNELTMIATGSGASVEVAAAALVADVENLNRYLRPGFSYGGTCLSQSIESLRMTGMVANYQTPLLNALEAVNEQRFERTAAAILAAVPGGRVAIWGMTYKADVDDRIASPGATLAAYLAERGVEVHTYDPRVDNGHAGGYKVCASIAESLVAADALVATVAHPEFAVVPAGQILDAVGRESVFDLVGALPQLGVR